NAPGHETYLNARFWILQELDVFNRACRLAQFQVDVIAREYFPVLTAVKVERRALESRGHDDLRRRRGNEMDQGKGNNRDNADDRGQCLEYLPSIESHNQHLPIAPVGGNDSNTSIKTLLSGPLQCE